MEEIMEATNYVWNPTKSDIIPTRIVELLYSEMFRSSTNPGQTVIDVVPNCPTNDCAFPIFGSLAVCSACMDISHKLNRSCFTKTISKPDSAVNNVAHCTFSLPNGLQINQTTMADDTLAMSAMLPTTEPYNEAGSILQRTVLNASTSFGNVSADARQCSLSWCIKTYDSKTVNGSLLERALHSRAGWEWLSTDYDHTEIGQYTIETSFQNGRNVSAYAVGADTSIKIIKRMLYKLTFSNSKYLKVESTDTDDSSRLWKDKISNFTGRDIRTVAYLRDTIKITRLFGFEEVFSKMAKALTTYVRNKGSTDQREMYEPDSRHVIANLVPIEPVNGTAYISKVYIEIRWPSLIFLASLLACTILFLTLTIHKSSKYKTAGWKSEPLALTYHGLEASKEDFQRLDRVGDRRRQGKRTRVQLQETDLGFRLGYAER